MSDLDPLDLPIFGAGALPGRQRSSFQLGPVSDGPSTVSLSPMPTSAASALPAAPRLQVVPGGAASVVQPAKRQMEVSLESVDWDRVAEFRQEVADRLADVQGDGRLDSAGQEAEGWVIIRQVLDEDDAEQLLNTGEARGIAERAALAQAIFDSVFRLGRLQPLVDDDSIENIMITGYDRVFVERADGTIERMPAVADSDEELARFVEYLAGRAENPRTFTPSQPSLDMALPGGARLAAARDTARVSVTIRRHRVRQVTLADLVEWGSLTPVLANFFSAAVKAKLSIVIAAGMGVGKTTFLRALCAEMDASEIIGTFESDYELYLHEMHDQHWVCHAWEVRTGSGEVSFNGRPAGSRSTMEQIIASYRHRLDRQIVGEVRGEEVWDMVKAMESGAGSLSTTHAVSATKAIDKLISCAMEAGPQISPEVAARKLAQTVDLVVQLGAEVVREGPGGEVARKRRYVEEVVEVVPGEKGVGYATNVIFRRQPGQCAVANMPPDGLMDSLIAHGLNQSAFKSEMAQSLRPERFS